MTTKISETLHYDEQTNQIIKQEVHDFTPVLEKAKSLRSAGLDGLGKDNKLVGLIPMKMWHEWAKKWGVSPSDTAAMRDVVLREMMDSDNAHLRVWEGRI